jgi:ribosomal protein L37AE/L43A
MDRVSAVGIQARRFGPAASVIPGDDGARTVTAVIDISCPACGRTDAVRKEGLGTYRCGACGEEFDQSAVEP